MCHRMSPLEASQMRLALDSLKATGHAQLPVDFSRTKIKDAYPGSRVPLFVPKAAGELTVQELSWGFLPQFASGKLVFNTRIETALVAAQTQRGMWAHAIVHGRCLVPVRCFYEYNTQAAKHARASQQVRREADELILQRPAPASPKRRPPSPQVKFELPGFSVFLLACVTDGEHFSVVTTAPNQDMSPIHNRMPLVLGPGESGLWLGPQFDTLIDRSQIRLSATPEDA
jgi:putative SOS response-associated peptidase YedK